MSPHSVPTPLDPAADPFGWLEEVEGAEALAWVRARNEQAMAALGSDAAFDGLKQSILEVLDSDDRIPEVSRLGELYYNFWRDAAHERGIWRRTTLDSYRTATPEWETILDLDALNQAEDASWVWHGASVLRPEPGEPWRRALVSLSPGGSDTDVTREFDLVEKRFIPAAEGGFHRPAAKGDLSWVDADTVLVTTDFGEGTMTTSGYPRTVRLWRRGTPLEDAVLVFEGEAEDVGTFARHSRVPGFERTIVQRAITFFTQHSYLVTGLGTEGQQLVKLDVPDSADLGFHREWLMVSLRDDWTVAGADHLAGSLLAILADDFLAGSRAFVTLFEPTATTSLAGMSWTRHHAVLNVLDDVKNRLHVLTPPEANEGEWVRSAFPAEGGVLAIGAGAVDPVESDDVWVVTTGYLTPSTLSLATVARTASEPTPTIPEPTPTIPEPTPTIPEPVEGSLRTGLPTGDDPSSLRQAQGEPSSGIVSSGAVEHLKAAPAFFDATGLVTEQRFATSLDGTRVPYFVVGTPAQLHPEPGAEPAPTLLYGYGGFEISLTPGYSGAVGRAWLARGGVYAVANIRGGGEYGPGWHQAALKQHRHHAYEDFAAVADDLVAAGITVPGRLGAQGGSNGGLLMGNMLTQYPEKFGAIVVQVPLLDMKRYSHLLAGASWMAEYGDPDDPEQWEFVRTFSPYHLFDGSREYPPVLFTTSTKDDRVHPGHARKMAALMLQAGKDVAYYENIEGGHGGAATNAQAAHMAALAWTFLAARLG